MIELRGFDKIEEVKEQDRERTKLYNYLLAKDYLFAMTNEIFDAIKGLDKDRFDEVCYWINYDGIIGKEYERIIDSIKDGSFLTKKNRTFKEACKENNLEELANSFEKTNKTKVKKL